MLILSRKPSEQILIGENVVITVLAISGGHVRLGIEAPREIPIHRKEVYEALGQEEKTSQLPAARNEPSRESSSQNPSSDGASKQAPPPSGTEIGHLR